MLIPEHSKLFITLYMYSTYMYSNSRMCVKYKKYKISVLFIVYFSNNLIVQKNIAVKFDGVNLSIALRSDVKNND